MKENWVWKVCPVKSSCMHFGKPVLQWTNRTIPLNRRNQLRRAIYFAGLSGTRECAVKRSALLKKLDLPEHLTVNGLLDVLNILYSRDEFFTLISSLHLQ